MKAELPRGAVPAPPEPEQGSAQPRRGRALRRVPNRLSRRAQREHLGTAAAATVEERVEAAEQRGRRQQLCRLGAVKRSRATQVTAAHVTLDSAGDRYTIDLAGECRMAPAARGARLEKLERGAHVRAQPSTPAVPLQSTMTIALFETPAGYALFKVLDEAKLKDIRKNLREIGKKLDAELIKRKTMMDDAEKAADDLNNAHVVINQYTPETIHSLRAMWVELGKVFTGTRDQIQEAIMAEKVCGAVPRATLTL